MMEIIKVGLNMRKSQDLCRSLPRSHIFEPGFAVARIPTPILNTPHFRKIFGGESGASLPLDDKGLLRAIETVALPQTKFELLEKCDEQVFRVKTAEYAGENLFVDTRFLSPASKNTPERPKIIPPRKLILARLQRLIGATYLWGGNWPCIPQMLEFYPPAKLLSEQLSKTWAFQGVDCSGLLYWATSGYTPRNTSELVLFGKSLPIEGKSPEEIQKLVKPLDIIVWKGHVVVILNTQTSIESRHGMGVLTTDLPSRLREMIEQLKLRPASCWDSSSATPCFVINRWLA
jgi:hypothetical protein